MWVADAYWVQMKVLVRSHRIRMIDVVCPKCCGVMKDCKVGPLSYDKETFVVPVLCGFCLTLFEVEVNWF